MPHPEDLFPRPAVPVSALKHGNIGGQSSYHNSETSTDIVRNMPTGTSDSMTELLDQLRCANEVAVVEASVLCTWSIVIAYYSSCIRTFKRCAHNCLQATCASVSAGTMF